MDTFRVGAPWGLVRIEAVGSQGSIPEHEDPAVSVVTANDTCIVASVAHVDISEVEIRVLRGEDLAEGVLVFDGTMAVSRGKIEVADVVGDDFSYIFDTLAGNVTVRIFMDNPREAAVLEVQIP